MSMAVAKTYRSDSIHDWKSPACLSDFGIHEPTWPEGVTLGLEEFNFTEVYRRLKIAFVPCYRAHVYNDVVDLGLFHYVDGQNFLYAVLRNCVQIQVAEIPTLREQMRCIAVVEFLQNRNNLLRCESTLLHLS